MHGLWRTPGIIRFYVADTVSALGDYALWLAMGIWVEELTGSTSAAAAVLFVYTFGTAASAGLGRVVDRYPRRSLLVVGYLATAALLTSLFLVRGRGDVWLVYAVMLVYGLSGGLTTAAQGAMLPELLAGRHPWGDGGDPSDQVPAETPASDQVPADLLASANGVQQTLRTLLRLVAPAVGAGVLIGFGGPAVAVVDAGTFVIAALLIGTVPVLDPVPVPILDPVPVRVPVPVRSSAGSRIPCSHEAAVTSEESGFAYLRTHPVLWPIIVVCAASLFVISFSTALSFTVATRVLHHAASYVAVLTTMQGIGALVGGPTAAPLLRRLSRRGDRGESSLVIVALAGAVLATVLRAIPSEACVLAGNVAIGVAVPWLLVAAITAVQGRTPGPLRGRVVAAAAVAGTVPQVVGQAVGAGLVAVLPYAVVCGVVAVTLVTGALGLAANTRAG